MLRCFSQKVQSANQVTFLVNQDLLFALKPWYTVDIENDRSDQPNAAKGEKKMTIKKLLAMLLVFGMLLPMAACGEKPAANGDAEEVVDEMALRATDLNIPSIM